MIGGNWISRRGLTGYRLDNNSGNKRLHQHRLEREDEGSKGEDAGLTKGGWASGRMPRPSFRLGGEGGGGVCWQD